MTVLLLTLGGFAMAMAAMAIGVILTGRRLQGSCGGLTSGSCVCKSRGISPPADCPRKTPDSSRRPGSLTILD